MDMAEQIRGQIEKWEREIKNLEDMVEEAYKRLDELEG